jgi:hypothetical protein
VGLDKSSGTLVATKGTEYADISSLTIADLLSIIFTPNLALAGVKLQQGQATINEEAMFNELREFVGSGGSGSGIGDTLYLYENYYRRT